MLVRCFCFLAQFQTTMVKSVFPFLEIRIPKHGAAYTSMACVCVLGGGGKGGGRVLGEWVSALR